MNPLLPPSAQRNLILASRSPRRVGILRGLHFEFDVVPAADHVEDSAESTDLLRRPIECAVLKARDVAGRHRDATVIGADTVVVLGDEVLGKPRDDDEARKFLEKLSGRVHTVITGVAVVRAAGGVEIAGRELTRVRFRELGPEDVRGYVSSGEGRDKAGSYAVQGLGAGLVRAIDGCFYNVVGLPVSLLFDLLKRASGV